MTDTDVHYRKSVFGIILMFVCYAAVGGGQQDNPPDSEGVRYNVAAGPFYDNIFELGIAVIPTALYETAPGAKTSTTKLRGIYSSNNNWLVEAGTETYFYSDSRWFLDTSLLYAFTKVDVENFMRFFDPSGAFSISQSPSAEVEPTTLEYQGLLAYEFFEDFHFGPSLVYQEIEYDRGNSENAFSTVSMLPDKVTKGVGISATFDKRNNTLTPTAGIYISFDLKKLKADSKGGGLFGPSGFTLNGTDKYERARADLRYYFALNRDTTFAWRGKVDWHSSDAPKTTSELSRVAYGFTKEVGGRSAVGTDLQLRHWLNEKFGVVTTFGMAKTLDTTSGEEDLHYAAGLGVRYMLNQKDRLSVRLDLTYNDQVEDNLLLFFNVAEVF